MKLRLLPVCALLLSSALHAEVKQSAPDAFVVEHKATLKVAPEDAYIAIGRIGQWWSPPHTWSGDPSNLTLELRAGGCFCERWSGGEAEHMRVGFVQHNAVVRLLGGLGPLQGMGLTGTLELRIERDATGSAVTLNYRVSGDSLHQLTTLAPVVDGVLNEQFQRYGRFVETGSPELAAEASGEPSGD